MPRAVANPCVCVEEGQWLGMEPFARFRAAHSEESEIFRLEDETTQGGAFLSVTQDRVPFPMFELIFEKSSVCRTDPVD